MALAPEVKTSPHAAGRSDVRENSGEGKVENAGRQAAGGERSIIQATGSPARQGNAKEAPQQLAPAKGGLRGFADQQAGDADRQGVEKLAEAQRQLMEEIAGQLETSGRQIAGIAQEVAEVLRGCIPLPGISVHGFRRLQGTMSGLCNGVVQTNVHICQQMVRLAAPALLLDVQRQFIRQYVGAVMRGTASLMSVARQTAEPTLRSIRRSTESALMAVLRSGHSAREVSPGAPLPSGPSLQNEQWGRR